MSGPTATFFNAHFDRALVSAPFFNGDSATYTKGWVYKDLYMSPNPAWTLHNSTGGALCIPFPAGCNPCSQQAADMGNATFRADWIADMASKLGGGTYKGMVIDDVNMEISRIGSCNGGVQCNPAAPGGVNCPIDPATGLAMTNTAWKVYMATFLEQIRAAFPATEIVHNPLWFFGQPDADVNIARQIAAGDVQAIERGVDDGSITGGTGVKGFKTLMTWCDQVHARGKHVWYSATSTTLTLREYGLAAYYLSNDGNDYVGNQPDGANPTGAPPGDWWAPYDFNLGGATSSRIDVSSSVISRDFVNGRVYVNQPGGATQTINMGETFLTINGTAVTSVTLMGSRGAVLRRP